MQMDYDRVEWLRTRTSDAAEGATARLHMGDAVDADADRLAEVIACFQSTDHQSADEISGVAGSVALIAATT